MTTPIITKPDTQSGKAPRKVVFPPPTLIELPTPSEYNDWEDVPPPARIAWRGKSVVGVGVLCLLLLLGATLVWQSGVREMLAPQAKPQTSPLPAASVTPEIPNTLYHYTFADNIPSIIATGLRPSIRDPNNPSSDAQWGDGQYLTDFNPQEAATVTRYQVSAAFFTSPWLWGRPPNLKDIGWIQIKVNGLPVERVAPLFGSRFLHRSIYLNHSQSVLPLASRVVGTGVVVFQPSESGYR